MLTYIQSLARAIYARCSILVLDNCFSALDRNTEHAIASNLLGLQGLFRRMDMSVLFFTSSSMKGMIGEVDLQANFT